MTVFRRAGWHWAALVYSLSQQSLAGSSCQLYSAGVVLGAPASTICLGLSPCYSPIPSHRRDSQRICGLDCAKLV